MTQAVDVRVLLDKTAVLRRPAGGDREEVHLVVHLAAVGPPVESGRPTLSVVLLLDASGSMKGEPVLQVRRSAQLLSDALSSDDKLGVVAFADRAVEIAPLAALSVDARRAITRRVANIDANGHTNVEAALLEGKRLLGPRAEHERQVLVLLSDGQPTAGMMTLSELGELVAGMRPDVSLATLGFGVSHDADLLLGLARSGGGQYGFIADPDDASTEFARAVGAQADVVADAIEVALSPHDGVEIVEIYDAKPRFTRKGVVVDAPDLREGCSHVVVAKLLLDPAGERGARALMTVRVRSRAAGSRTAFVTEVTASTLVTDRDAQVNLEAHVFVELALAEQARRRARLSADQGNFDAAVALLTQVIARLEAIPGYVRMDGSPVSEAVEQLIDERAAYGRHPGPEQYAAFKADALGIDIAQGSQHADSVAMKSAHSRAIMGNMLGKSGDAELVIRYEDGEEQRVPMVKQEFVIGRVQGNDICLPGGNVSKRHARLVFRQGGLVITDLNSTNGTYVNRARINGSHPLKQGDRVYIGNYVLRIELPIGDGGPGKPGTVIPFPTR